MTTWPTYALLDHAGRPAGSPLLRVFQGNIAGARMRRRIRRIRRRMRRHLDDVLVLTEAYKARPLLQQWAEEHDYTLIQATRKAHGPEGPDIAVLVRHGGAHSVEVLEHHVVEMDERWFGPFNFPRSAKPPRRFILLTVRKAGHVYELAAIHFPSGGPSGGMLTRGRNRLAWAEAANFVYTWLTTTTLGAAIGDFNARARDLRKHVAPAGGRVAMASKVDGVITHGLIAKVRRLRSPIGMHGWSTTRLTPAA